MEAAPQTALALLEFEHRVRSCGSANEVAFCAVNETYNLLRFDQAVVWQNSALTRPRIIAASGLADVSVDSPYQQWLARLIRQIAPAPFTATRAVAFDDLPSELAAEGEEWCAAHLLVLPLRGPDGSAVGGLLLQRTETFSEAETAAAQWLAQTVGYALWGWYRHRPWNARWRESRRATSLMIAIAVLIVLAGFLPVRLTALAPAEITPVAPTPITAPTDGVVKEILVKPNDEVETGEIVAVLDDTAVRNQLNLSEKSLDVARAELQRATYKSFSDDASRLELQVLDTRVREKLAEVEHLTEVLGRLKLVAPRNGIAIFADPEEWRGRPVQVGERVMLVADPKMIDVTLYVAPDDAVGLEPGGEVAVFLHVDPLSSLSAKIEMSSYEALPIPDGSIAYLVRAQLDSGHNTPRIGLRGTAKVYAGRVSLAYYLFRKPLAFMRRSLGL
jgi:Biotin-lipoyl like/HlyD family secretion protein